MDKPKRGSLEAMVVHTGTSQDGNGNRTTEEGRRTPVGVFEDATKDRRVMLRYFKNRWHIWTGKALEVKRYDAEDHGGKWRMPRNPHLERVMAASCRHFGVGMKMPVPL